MWALEHTANRAAARYRPRHRQGWRPTPEALAALADRPRGVSRRQAARYPDGPADFDG